MALLPTYLARLAVREIPTMARTLEALRVRDPGGFFMRAASSFRSLFPGVAWRDVIAMTASVWQAAKAGDLLRDFPEAAGAAAAAAPEYALVFGRDPADRAYHYNVALRITDPVTGQSAVENDTVVSLEPLTGDQAAASLFDEIVAENRRIGTPPFKVEPGSTVEILGVGWIFRAS